MDPTSFDELRPGTYDVTQRVLDMSANGLLGSLNFPSLPGFAGRLFAALDDKDAALALCRAYNDWHIEEWCGAAPDRFIPLAIPPIWDPDALADEVRRVAKKGCHAITFPENPVPLGLPSLHTDHWDPFWQACNDEGTIVNMHIGSSGEARDHRAGRAGRRDDHAAADEHRAGRGRPASSRRCSRSSPTSRSRCRRAASAGSPTSSSGSTTRTRRTSRGRSPTSASKLPSEVFMERVILCFIEDDFGARHAREIGTDRICIETDYPHSDAIWPNAPERLMQAFGADRSHRPRDQPDDAPERDAVLPVRPVLDPAAREVHRRRAARRSVGHDVSIGRRAGGSSTTRR